MIILSATSSDELKSRTVVEDRFQELSRSIISENTQSLCMKLRVKNLGVTARCAQTMTECAKVRQATVFLVEDRPIETG